jgi:hypothetical protein
VPNLLPSDETAVNSLPERQEFQCREQRPVALVVVRHSSATTFLQREPRLGAIQGLNLAYIRQFLQELRIPRQLERFHPMRFEVVTCQMLLIVDLLTPWPAAINRQLLMGHPFGLRAKSRIHDCLDLPRFISCLASASRRHLPQTIQTFLLKRACHSVTVLRLVSRC